MNISVFKGFYESYGFGLSWVPYPGNLRVYTIAKSTICVNGVFSL